MAQFASDAFTGTSGTVLQTYDSNWVEHSSSSGDDATIESNRVGSRSVGNTTKLYYHQGAPASADYSVSSDVYCVTNVGAGGVVGRVNTAANTFYMARCDATAAGYTLYKAVSGTFTQIGSTSSATFSSSTTYQVKLKMVGSTIELFKAGEGTATISVTDTAITAAGKSGLRHNANQTTGFHIDNFSADDVSSGQTISVPAAPIQRQAFAPTVTATANKTIAVPLASREIQAFAPTVSTSADVTIDVPLATRQIQAFAPTVQAPRNIAVPAASIERQAFAPTVTVSADRVIQVPLASIERQAFAPTVGTTATIAVGVASKQWQAFAPTVTTEATADEITGRAVRRYRRRIQQQPEPDPIEPSAPVVASQPVRTPVTSLIPDANTLIVEQAGKARKLAKTAEQKRRIAVELDDERALSEALMEWF